MKYNIKISNISFDIEITEKEQVKPEPPVIVEPPIVKPPIIVVPDQPFDLDNYLLNKEGVVRLPEQFEGRETIIKSAGLVEPNKVKALISKNALLTYSDWGSAPTQQFNLSKSEEFGIVGICFVTPPNRPIKTGFPDKELFGWDRDSVISGKFAYIDAPKVADTERVTYGLSRFCYSSDSEKMIYLIGENLRHNGFNFTQIKNPYKGNLFLYLKDIQIYNPIVIDQGGPNAAPSSMYYSPTRIKVRVSVKDGFAKIISDNTYDQILTHWGYWENGVSSILHFDRYAFPISKELILDLKTLKLESIHPLDNINGKGTVLTKQINLSSPERFNYTYDISTKNDQTKVTLPEGEFDAFIAYKEAALFSMPLDKSSYFDENDYWGSGIITNSGGYGWSWYNQMFTGYIENLQGSGYFRNSGGTGITKGLTIRNSTFEKNAPTPTSNSNPPIEVIDYIKWLRSI